jgi:cytochrome c oxidase subunit 1
MVFIAVGPLTAAQIMLTLDRYVGSHIFDTQAGGSAVLWMHYFWIFGHPEVYILVLPAFAFVNEIVPVFSRKAIFGYPAMVAASIAIGFISLSVWAHHMFTVGLGPFSSLPPWSSRYLPGSRFSTGWLLSGVAVSTSPSR